MSQAKVKDLEEQLAAEKAKNTDLQKKVKSVQDKARKDLKNAKRTAAVDTMEPADGRLLKAGTVVKMADVNMTLMQDAVVVYPNYESEAAFAGMCHLSGENLEVNRSTLRFKYDGFGIRLPLQEQVDDPEQLPAFKESLTDDEAQMFGIDRPRE